jgi:hypothetical protein
MKIVANPIERLTATGWTWAKALGVIASGATFAKSLS